MYFAIKIKHHLTSETDSRTAGHNQHIVVHTWSSHSCILPHHLTFRLKKNHPPVFQHLLKSDDCKTARMIKSTTPPQKKSHVQCESHNHNQMWLSVAVQLTISHWAFIKDTFKQNRQVKPIFLKVTQAIQGCVLLLVCLNKNCHFFFKYKSSDQTKHWQQFARLVRDFFFIF